VNGKTFGYVKCYSCEKFGHVKFQCPSPKTKAVLPPQAVKLLTSADSDEDESTGGMRLEELGSLVVDPGLTGRLADGLSVVWRLRIQSFSTLGQLSV